MGKKEENDDEQAESHLKLMRLVQVPLFANVPPATRL